MVYRISATFGGTSGVFVIVKTAEQALAKIAEYREDGLTAIVVRDLDGVEVDPERLAA